MEKTEISLKVFPEIEERVVELSNQLETLMVNGAPEAWATALAVVKIDAVVSLIWAAGLLIGLIITYSLARKAWALQEEEGYHMWQGEVRFFICLGSVVFGGGFFIGLIGNLSPWVWVGLFNPELVIARKIMASVL